MWGEPNKYSTKCVDESSGEMLADDIYEAINKDEAEARALLNCINISGKQKGLKVTVDRI